MKNHYHLTVKIKKIKFTTKLKNNNYVKQSFKAHSFKVNYFWFIKKCWMVEFCNVIVLM